MCENIQSIAWQILIRHYFIIRGFFSQEKKEKYSFFLEKKGERNPPQENSSGYRVKTGAVKPDQIVCIILHIGVDNGKIVRLDQGKEIDLSWIKKAY